MRICSRIIAALFQTIILVERNINCLVKSYYTIVEYNCLERSFIPNNHIILVKSSKAEAGTRAPVFATFYQFVKLGASVKFLYDGELKNFFFLQALGAKGRPLDRPPRRRVHKWRQSGLVKNYSPENYYTSKTFYPENPVLSSFSLLFYTSAPGCT